MNIDLKDLIDLVNSTAVTQIFSMNFLNSIIETPSSAFCVGMHMVALIELSSYIQIDYALCSSRLRPKHGKLLKHLHFDDDFINFHVANVFNCVSQV